MDELEPLNPDNNNPPQQNNINPPQNINNENLPHDALPRRRNRDIHYDENNWLGLINLDNSLNLIYTKSFLLSSLFISMLILGYLHLRFVGSDITIKDLENEDMLFSYFLIILVVSAIIWDFFLFIHKIIFSLEYQNIEDVSTLDAFYFNPIFFNLFLYFINKHFMITSFDILAWWIISYTFGINYLFALNLFNYSNHKINTITNFLAQNTFLLKIRLNYLVLICLNFSFIYLMKCLLEEASLTYKYIIFFKGFYLFMKQIEFWVLNEINLIQIKSGTCENFILKINTIRVTIQILNMMLILHMYLVANNYFLFNGSYFIFGVFTTLILKFIFDIRMKYKAFQNFKEFMNKLDSVFPKIALESNTNEECTICKENLVNARKLSCNHYFHLICLSKWIEKGNKNCPLCRKDIEINLSRAEANNLWTFGFRLETNALFSWLPNFTLRVIRSAGAAVVTDDSVNSIADIFPDVARDDIVSSLTRTRNVNSTINEFLQR